ncbi:hypothetical protein [Arthrobacter sp. LFS091]|uniref:hypothetical protein n=1 Tax=Arthrobacter sp. LFS091 TaxID=3229892 RepID=UPI003A809F09
MYSSAAAIKGPPGQSPKPGTLGTALGAFGVAGIMGIVAVVLHGLGQQSPYVGPGYSGWAQAAADSPAAAARWFLGDMTEPLFYKSDLAALGLLAGAGLARWVGRRQGRVGRRESLGPWILASASLSLLLSNVAFGWLLDDGWQPTFVPFVCVAPAVVILYGAGWQTCLTGAVLGAATVTPLALIFIPILANPLGLPPVVANVLAMSGGSILSFLVARRLPWLVLREREPDLGAERNLPASGFNQSLLGEALWAARRVIRDFTETHFIAKGFASVGMLSGAVVAHVLNPGLPSYGSGLLPHILFAQALTSAIGVVLWRGWYLDGGWAATYASVVSVAPAAVLATGGSFFGVVGGAILGAVLAPPLARVFSAKLPADFHPVVGNTAAMAVSTAVAVPLLGLLPA